MPFNRRRPVGSPSAFTDVQALLVRRYRASATSFVGAMAMAIAPAAGTALLKIGLSPLTTVILAFGLMTVMITAACYLFVHWRSMRLARQALINAGVQLNDPRVWPKWRPRGLRWIAAMGFISGLSVLSLSDRLWAWSGSPPQYWSLAMGVVFAAFGAYRAADALAAENEDLRAEILPRAG